GPTLAAAVADAHGTVLLDSVTTWLAAAPGFEVDADALCTALAKRGGDTVVVSDEVGLGVHPSTEAGNRFRDALGLLNQQIAVCADDVFLVVAGRTLSLS
ncbi:MAG: adenosylcobinamide kinase/adenosylcobinamide phosphate guanyltransferase, partial [Actinobacteria bacterium]